MLVCLRKSHRLNWYMSAIDNWQIGRDDACITSLRISGYYIEYGFPDRCVRFECFYNVLLLPRKIKI